jgi:hypothetical protein
MKPMIIFRTAAVATVIAATPLAAQDIALPDGFGKDSAPQGVVAEPDTSQFERRAPEESNEIVVTGYRREEIRSHVYEVIDVDADQLARREEPFCPRVVNFPEEYLPIIERLIRENARRVNVPLAGPDCLADAFAVFARDPQAFTRAVYEDYPSYFESLNRPERRRMIAEEQPVYTWTLKVLRDRYGGALPGDPPRISGVDISRLTRNVRQDIEGTFVIIDIDRTRNMTLQQLADFIFVNMVIEFKEDARENSAPDSILHLFEHDDPVDAPQNMSPMDLALVEALYAQPRNDRSARVQRGRITDYIVAKLEREGLAED